MSEPHRCCNQRCECRARARAPWCRCGEPVLVPVLPPGGLELDRWLEMLAWSMLDQAIEHTAGNKARAARLLGLNRTTLVERLKRYGHPAAAK